MKKAILIAIAIVFCDTTVFASHSITLVSDTTKSKKVKPAKILYTCTMHPDYITDKPGKCPKPDCGMTLVKKEPAKKSAR